MKRVFWIGIAALSLAILSAGCRTPDHPSEMPWNTPASWEAEGPIMPM